MAVIIMVLYKNTLVKLLSSGGRCLIILIQSQSEVSIVRRIH